MEVTGGAQVGATTGTDTDLHGTCHRLILPFVDLDRVTRSRLATVGKTEPCVQGCVFSSMKEVKVKTVKFSKMQAEEIAYKLCIVRDEDDLLESYEVSMEEVDIVAAMFLRPYTNGNYSFDEKFVEVITREIENLIEIAESNLGLNSDHDEAVARGYLSSMHGALRKLAAC